MALQKITEITGTGVCIPGDDIDTDRIIPARFLKSITFDGLGQYAFYDVRFDASGNKKDHPLNDPRFSGASVMVGYKNFGCGSSREHAPQALYRAGVRVIIAENFAEIFFGNSTGIGLVCLDAKHEDIERLHAAIEKDPKTEIKVNVASGVVAFNGQTIQTTQRSSAREALIQGRWDSIADLLEGSDATAEKAKQLPYFK